MPYPRREALHGCQVLGRGGRVLRDGRGVIRGIAGEVG